MATIQKLTHENETLYPQTVAKAVLFPNGDTLEDKWSEIPDITIDTNLNDQSTNDDVAGAKAVVDYVESKISVFLGQYPNFSSVPASGLVPKLGDTICVSDSSDYIQNFVARELYTVGRVCRYEDVVYKCIQNTNGSILPTDPEHFEVTDLPLKITGTWVFVYNYNENVGKYGFYPQYQTSDFTPEVMSLIYAGL